MVTEQIWICIGGCGRSTTTIPYPERPLWPYLCSECANEPPRKNGRPTLWPHESEDDPESEARITFFSIVGEPCETI